MKSKIIQSSALILTTLFAVIATYISFTMGNILAYNDATAHLNTARRVIDNLTPGMVQLGSVWLPLLHIFEIPFVANYTLWQTGLAGSIVSGLSFIIASFFLYKLTLVMTNKPFAALLGVLAFITNLNLLYLQSTAMFEPLLMATELGAVYFLTIWAKDKQLRDLILAAFFTMLATVTRYDGYALFLAAGIYVLIISLFSNSKAKESSLIVFIALASFGIAMWLLYNLMIFGDALYFARSEYSAAAQQNILYAKGALLTKHDLLLSFLTYSFATVYNNGIVIIGAALTGMIVYLFSRAKKIYYLGPLILLVPYFFNIASLYLGQSVIWMPELPPHYDTYFNIRYGILMLPAFAFFVGYLTSKHYIFMILVVFAMIGQTYLFLHPETFAMTARNRGLVTLNDTVSSVNAQTKKASSFLHDNYQNGLIMVSSASSDAFIFRSGIPLKNDITEGTGNYWRESLRDPSKYATWLVFFVDRTDRVGKAMPPDTILSEKYQMVYKDQTYEIWKKLPKY